MTYAARLLLVEDDDTFREVLADHLVSKGYQVMGASRVADARRLAFERRLEGIVLDQRLPDGDGVALAQELLAAALPTKIILITAHADVARAIAATRAGVFDYLQKPLDLAILEDTIGRAVRAARDTARWNRSISGGSPSAPPTLIGGSAATVRLRAQLEAAGRACPAPVLISGETGAGKGLAARLVHASGPRARGPLVTVNCAAIPEAIFDAELFGHERGAFTGAIRSSTGLFEAAHGGTLVLDEIGEVSLAMQSKLLRALEDGVVRRIGANAERPVDVHVIATTNCPVETQVERGAFRRDLYFRLAVIRIEVPPLRDRIDDLPLLVRGFLEEFGDDAAFGPPADELAIMAAHSWPGNVRELRNALQRWLLARAAGTAESIDDILHPTQSGAPGSHPSQDELDELSRTSGLNFSGPSATGPFPTLAEAERQHIERALQRVGQNRSQAARLLGISRTTLRRKLAGGDS